MAAKRALVVDDSKSARVVLSRMLEKYSIEVDSAESAEAALDYLRSNQPDVIFMDHMMPGMDGLQAVRQIKADPRIAMIPIMMYTSQEGELYAGQARALGAIGVLPKSIRPIDVTKALYQLNMLPDRRDSAPPVLQPIGEEGVAPPAPAAPAAPGRGQLDALLKEQSLELRRFIVATLDAHAHRITAELRPPEPEPFEAPPPRVAAPWGWVVATLAALAALTVTGFLYWQASEASRQAQVAFEAATASNGALMKALEEWRAQPPPVAETVAAAATPRISVLEVPYGEPALAPARLDALRALVLQMEAQGLRGHIRVSPHAGSFCLAASEQGYQLAARDTPATACDQIGNPLDDGGASRQPVSFANLAATVQSRTAGGIVLEFVPGVRDRVAVAYPPLEQATAGQWNAAAQANNRVEIVVLPQ